jgi:hypothetical protein
MTAREPGEFYWKKVQPIWKSVSIYDGGEAFLAQFYKLSEVQRNLFAAHWCQSEVCNGGFHQFFANPTGVLAPEAAVAFDALELPAGAALIRRAMDFFGSPYPREQMDRCAILDVVPGDSRAERDPFYALDDLFYAVLDSLNHVFAKAADAYALRNAPRLTSGDNKQ